MKNDKDKKTMELFHKNNYQYIPCTWKYTINLINYSFVKNYFKI